MVQMIHVVIDSYLIIVMFYRFASAKNDTCTNGYLIIVTFYRFASATIVAIDVRSSYDLLSEE